MEKVGEERKEEEEEEEEKEEEEEGEEEFQVWNPLIWVFDMNSKVSMEISYSLF